MRLHFCFLFGLAALGFPGARADFVHGDGADSNVPSDIKVDVVVDMEPAGKKIAHPTRDKPAYYLPIVTGYKEEGRVLSFYQRPPPPTGEVEHMLAKAMADQGYLIFTKQFHPSLVLFFSWGYWAPLVRYPGQMLSLVGGQTSDDDPSLEEVVRANEAYSRIYDPRKLLIIEAARRPRYYLLVKAIDYKDFTQGRITPLWKAHISVAYWGHYLDETLPTLIAKGVPLFGVDTHGPQWIDGQTVPVGRVVSGQPVFKGYETPPAPPNTENKP